MSHCDGEALLHGPETCPNHSLFAARARRNFLSFAADFCDMIVDQFDEMAEQCERHPLVMNVSVRTYVFGQPFRLRRLKSALRHCLQHPQATRVWWTRPRDVADFCYSLAPGIIPGGHPAG